MSSSARALSDTEVWNTYCKHVQPLRCGKVSNTAPSNSAWSFSQQLIAGHTLDLHGLTVAEAHTRTSSFLSTARGHYRYVTVITGRSGAIHEEFPHWLDGYSGVSRVEPMNGGGAFRVHFRKPGKQSR